MTLPEVHRLLTFASFFMTGHLNQRPELFKTIQILNVVELFKLINNLNSLISSLLVRIIDLDNLSRETRWKSIVPFTCRRILSPLSLSLSLITTGGDRPDLIRRRSAVRPAKIRVNRRTFSRINPNPRRKPTQKYLKSRNRQSPKKFSSFCDFKIFKTNFINPNYINSQHNYS